MKNGLVLSFGPRQNLIGSAGGHNLNIMVNQTGIMFEGATENQLGRAVTTTTLNTITAAPTAPTVQRAGPGMCTVTFSVPSFIEVQVYGAHRDPSGYGEGWTFRESRSANLTASTASIVLTPLLEDGSDEGCFTVMHFSLTQSQSSEFSKYACVSRPGAFLPVLRR